LDISDTKYENLEKFMKKLMLFLQLIVIILSLTACSSNGAKDLSNSEQNTAQSSKDRAAEEAKSKEKENQEKVIKLITLATVNLTSATIKSAKDSNAELTDESIKSENYVTIKKLEERLILIDTAEKAVKDYQKHATDYDYQRKAAIAIKAIKDKNDNDIKTKLLKLYNTSVEQAKAAVAAEKAHQEQLKAEQQAREKAAQEEAARVQAEKEEQLQVEREAKAAAEQAQKEQQEVAQTAPEANSSGYSTDSSGWAVAAPGYCFISRNNIYHSAVRIPGNFTYTTIAAAEASGARHSKQANGSARP
jgi:predicted small lipoprotein YifL